MSIALAHFAIGATFATIAILYFVPDAPYPRVLVLLSGAWATLPDVTKLDPPYAARIASLAESVWANVFWLHPRIDTIDASNSILFAAVALGVFLGVTALAERWAYTVREHLPTADSGDVSPTRSLALLRSGLAVAAVGYAGLLISGAVIIDAFRILYIGTAAALGITGFLGGGMAPVSKSHWIPWASLPDKLTTALQLAITFSTLIIATGLTTSLQTVAPLDAVYLGLALLVILLLSMLASCWSKPGGRRRA